MIHQDAEQTSSSNPANRIRPLVACVITVALCFLYAASRKHLPDWWRGHGGGIPYVLFWIFLWLTILPYRKAVVPICIGCVLFTCGLEFLQMWDGPNWFNDFRRTRFGAAWLGFGFDWNDMPPYVLGGILGAMIGFPLTRRAKTLA